MTGSGLIILNSIDVLVENVNIAITADDDVECQFVAVEEVDESGAVTSVTCLHPDASSVCTAPFELDSDIEFINPQV